MSQPLIHVVQLNPEQVDITQDDIAFVDIRLKDFDSDDHAIWSIHHTLIPNVIAQLAEQYGELMRVKAP